MSMGLSGHPSD